MVVLFGGNGYFTGTGTALTYQGSVTDFTAECWVELIGNVTTTPHRAIFFGKESTGGDVTFGLGMDLTSGYKLISALKTDIGSYSQDIITLEPWIRYHIVLTYNGATAKTYLNGNLLNSTEVTRNIIME